MHDNESIINDRKLSAARETSSGYIAIYRQLLDWEWYKDINVKTLFFHCLLKANWKQKQWQGITIERGSFISSIEILSVETGLSIRQVRTALDKLKKTGEMSCQATNKFTVLTVVKYSLYQTQGSINDKPDDNQMTTERQTDDNQMTTTNKDNNLKNEEKHLINIREIEFIELWKKLKLEYDNVTISKKSLTKKEREGFEFWLNRYSKEPKDAMIYFEQAIRGLLFQNTNGPSRSGLSYIFNTDHGHFETMIDCWINQNRMFGFDVTDKPMAKEKKEPFRKWL